jgi:hypothetical protein
LTSRVCEGGGQKIPRLKKKLDAIDKVTVLH